MEAILLFLALQQQQPQAEREDYNQRASAQYQQEVLNRLSDINISVNYPGDPAMQRWIKRNPSGRHISDSDMSGSFSQKGHAFLNFGARYPRQVFTGFSETLPLKLHASWQ